MTSKFKGKEMIRVDRVVSLGSNCEVTAALRDYFNVDRAYPFDWWITPLKSVKKILRDDFKSLLNSEFLEVSKDKNTVHCKHYNILHHHDFTRGEGYQIIPDIESQIPNLKAKFEYLADRFFKDCATGKNLFIRNRVGYDSYLDQDGGDIQEDYEDLYRLICEIFPLADNYLLVTNVGHAGVSQNGKIFFDDITNHGECDDFRVSPKGWRELFERQKFVLRNNESNIEIENGNSR